MPRSASKPNGTVARKQSLPIPAPIDESLLAAPRRHRATTASTVSSITGAEGLQLYRCASTVTDSTIDNQPIAAAFDADFTIEDATSLAIADPPPNVTICMWCCCYQAVTLSYVMLVPNSGCH
jgi:hypothetical protein